MTTGSPRRRPHPARRARRTAGSLSVAALFALTGCIAATTKATATRSTATNATATSTTAATTVATDDDSVAASRSTSVAAVAATASTQSNTSSHAS